MAFEFVCPFCHSRLRVDDRFAGLSGPCAECGNQVTMPGRPETSGPIDASQPGTAGSKSDQPSSRSWSSRIALVLIMLVAVACLGLLASTILLPSARDAFSRRQRTLGLSNAKQIADALNAYRRTHGQYPTPIVVDPAGKPLYSWRVLILPQLGYSSLYDQYQHQQSWDSPTNIELMTKMPAVYACPDNSDALAMHETNFALIVGPGSMFPAGTAVDPDTMLDHPAETLLVVETKDGGYTWTQPRDLSTSKGIKLGSRPMIDIGGNYPECALAITVDGSPMAIKPSISRTALDAIISPNGQETVDLESICLPTKP